MQRDCQAMPTQAPQARIKLNCKPAIRSLDKGNSPCWSSLSPLSPWLLGSPEADTERRRAVSRLTTWKRGSELRSTYGVQDAMEASTYNKSICSCPVDRDQIIPVPSRQFLSSQLTPGQFAAARQAPDSRQHGAHRVHVRVCHRHWLCLARSLQQRCKYV